MAASYRAVACTRRSGRRLHQQQPAAEHSDFALLRQWGG